MLHEIYLRVSTTNPVMHPWFLIGEIVPAVQNNNMHSAPSENLFVDQQADFCWQLGEEEGFGLRAVALPQDPRGVFGALVGIRESCWEFELSL
jgi:hypothetical protein